MRVQSVRPEFNHKSSHTKDWKMALDATLLKLCIKGNVEQSRERSSALHYTSGMIAIEKRDLRVALDRGVTNFTLLLYYINQYITTQYLINQYLINQYIISYINISY